MVLHLINTYDRLWHSRNLVVAVSLWPKRGKVDLCWVAHVLIRLSAADVELIDKSSGHGFTHFSLLYLLLKVNIVDGVLLEWS
jgi:hypothetical protein